MELDPNFKEFIELLNEHEVKYLVVGGYAVNFHGYPRFTHDIDFWLWTTEENILKVQKTLVSFGFGGLGIEKEDFENPENIIQLGYEPFRIDLLMDVDGVDFLSCYENRVVADLEGLLINFLSLEDLIDSKKAMGRLQDLADAENLQKINREEE